MIYGILIFLFKLFSFKGGKAFTSPEFLKTHFDTKHFDQRIKAREDGSFECKICNRELIKYGFTERHMRSFHPDEEKEEEDSEVHTMSSKFENKIFNFFKCHFCTFRIRIPMQNLVI